jgi:hypothetical protein
MRPLNLRFAFLLGASALLSACASTPKEVVQLSAAMGEDLSAVHQSYRELVHDRFDRFRAERMDYLNNTWKPRFLGDWVQKGRLSDIAGGQVVWSKSERKFTAASQGQENEQKLQSLQLWAQNAIAKIEKKKKELLDPIDNDEKEILRTVDDSFSRLYRANAAITAHLNSLRKVQAVQDQALEALKVRDLRDKVNDMLIKSSEKARQGLEEVQKADQKVEKISEVLQAP